MANKKNHGDPPLRLRTQPSGEGKTAVLPEKGRDMGLKPKNARRFVEQSHRAQLKKALKDRPLVDLTKEIREEIWPAERKVLFNPDRLRYVRRLVKPKGCVFCEASRKGVGFKRLLLHRGKHAIVVLNKYPYNNGHALVLPRRHTGDFLELTVEEHAEINLCLKRVIRALQDAYAPAGFNVGLNLGAAAGAGIPEHLHYHVIPRWRGDTNFFPLIAETKVVVETLEQTFERLLPYFEGSKK